MILISSPFKGAWVRLCAVVWKKRLARNLLVKSLISVVTLQIQRYKKYKWYFPPSKLIQWYFTGSCYQGIHSTRNSSPQASGGASIHKYKVRTFPNFTCKSKTLFLFSLFTVELHNVFESETFIFLVFELCRNGELFDHLTNVVALSEKKTR